jgi:ferrous iron transport protein B
MSTIALVGNPNCGKTTLFNALTGSRQHVGNWPGVTVDRKSGFFIHQHIRFEVVDLPGVYSLMVTSETAAVDESVACQFILQQEADVVVNIVDGSNLERHLYLTMQLIEMGVPLIVVVNMMDVAKTRGFHLQLDLLSSFLGCPVVPLQANKGKGLTELKNKLLNSIATEGPKGLQHTPAIPYVAPLPQLIKELAGLISQTKPDLASLAHFSPEWLASRLLEDDLYAKKQVMPELLPSVVSFQEKIREEQGEDADILLADARYRFIHEIVSNCLTRVSAERATWTSYLDKIILNRFLGLPLFLAMMYFLFFFAINIGGAFQDFFDIASNTIFVDGFSQLLLSLGFPKMVVALLASGVGKGLNTTITFIPVIGALFLFLSFLEDSGYMARAAFVVDRLMRAFGLPGKAFVPMIVGFGCNVPAVMAARTLENKRDRILTIMMSPFMSCGARLAIYAVFTAAFFPASGSKVVFALYLIGIMMAVLTGVILRKTLLYGQPAPLVMELPPYHFPQVRTLFLHAWQRLKTFIFRAGKLIVPICVFIGMLHLLNLDGTLNQGEGDAHSILAALGRFMTPIFAPMGIHQDNWPATVGLVTGILAKEVVVGTLNTLYSQMAHFMTLSSGSFHLWDNLYAALLSIPDNFRQLGQAAVHPFSAAAPSHTLNQVAYGVMYQHFDGKIGAFSYLLFVLLYFPCVSTTAAMLRELDYRWAIFSILWMSSVAYGAAVIFYQAATLAQHPSSSLLWIAGILLLFAGVIASLRFVISRENKEPQLTDKTFSLEPIK